MLMVCVSADPGRACQARQKLHQVNSDDYYKQQTEQQASSMPVPKVVIGFTTRGACGRGTGATLGVRYGVWCVVVWAAGQGLGVRDMGLGV